MRHRIILSIEHGAVAWVSADAKSGGAATKSPNTASSHHHAGEADAGHQTQRIVLARSCWHINAAPQTTALRKLVMHAWYQLRFVPDGTDCSESVLTCSLRKRSVSIGSWCTPLDAGTSSVVSTVPLDCWLVADGVSRDFALVCIILADPAALGSCELFVTPYEADGAMLSPERFGNRCDRAAPSLILARSATTAIRLLEHCEQPQRGTQ